MRGVFTFSNLFLVLLSIIAFSACTTFSSVEVPADVSSQYPHSFARPDEAVVKHLDLDVEVDFENKVVKGVATWDIELKEGDRLVLDTRGLQIEKVERVEKGGNVFETGYLLGSDQDYLGQPLAIEVDKKTEQVKIHYTSGKDAAALLWMEKNQTLGKQLPILFSQGQPIMTRSWIPCQDSPGIKFTYNAKVKVPPGMLALMSAKNPIEKRADGVYTFSQTNPVPAYLVAIAAGDLVFEKVSSRCGIFAEPAIINDAYYEFNHMEDMLKTAESICGPYQWGEFNVLVLPPSFPFGGMENPMLTFVTPTLIVGDRSLVSTVAHEIAHSWSGNLVTNATWNDFWLNEGITTYLEWRIMEALEGPEAANMLILNGREIWQDDVKQETNEGDTRLKTDLKGRNPMIELDNIAYEKGANFLLLIERKVGRDKMDQFLKKYFQTYAGQTIDTETFLSFLKKELTDQYAPGLPIDEWVYQPGIPASLPEVKSARFEYLDGVIAKINAWSSPTRTVLNGLSAQEWVYFINHLPIDLDNRMMKSLDLNFNFTSSKNAEIKSAWFALTIKNGYAENIYSEIEQFLMGVGRAKFLTPIYRALMKRGFKAKAENYYKMARPFYHDLTREKIEQVINA
ncbi:MAG: M1 family metallopeptidase [Saprospiraceae bacterium]|nr:M1 family metallopeptidase [Saprospiraceae bacterium]